MGSWLNSTVHERNTLYQFSAIPFREQKQKEYFLTQARIALIPKGDKGISRHYRPNSFVNSDEQILNKIFATRIQQCIKRIIIIP